MIEILEKLVKVYCFMQSYKIFDSRALTVDCVNLFIKFLLRMEKVVPSVPEALLTDRQLSSVPCDSVRACFYIVSAYIGLVLLNGSDRRKRQRKISSKENEWTKNNSYLNRFGFWKDDSFEFVSGM